MSPVAHTIANRQTQGRLPANILNFVHLLRGAGLKIGPGRVLDGVRAAQAVGIARRDDFYWALHAVFVARHEQHDLFNQAFRLFWQNPDLTAQQTGSAADPDSNPTQRHEPGEPVSRRLLDALRGHDTPPPAPEAQEERDIDASMTWSARRALGAKDFEQMSADEIEEAKRAITEMRLPVPEIATRRMAPDPAGRRIDMRRSFAKSIRQGGQIIALAHRSRRYRHPPLIVLCDISGSMNLYSRMFLHFIHALSNRNRNIHAFVFGTSLTNISRALTARDVDDALAKIGGLADDWSGGTRIGACLHDFNRHWSRRVLAQNASVLLITDGLDRDGGQELATEISRLQRSCRRLIWLNPLMRYEKYAPLALGARALAPHVDELRTIHNLGSMRDLVAALCPVRDQIRTGRDGTRQPTKEHAA